MTEEEMKEFEAEKRLEGSICVRSFVHNNQVLHHRLFVRTDDRVELLDRSNTPLVIYTSSCTVTLPDGKLLGGLRLVREANLCCFTSVDGRQVNVPVDPFDPEPFLSAEVLLSKYFLEHLPELQSKGVDAP